MLANEIRADGFSGKVEGSDEEESEKHSHEVELSQIDRHHVQNLPARGLVQHVLLQPQHLEQLMNFI